MQPTEIRKVESASQTATKSGSFAPATTAISDEELRRASDVLSRLVASFQSRVVGQDGLRLSLLVALLCEGHILLESVPGLAKTTAVQTLAESMQGSYHRIQCTPDLLPSDIIGTQVYNYTKGTFETQLGPVHANLVLLDEINRSSAKTQSAMLEAMQERQTTIGGVVYQLPHPFIVLATQNPIEQEGTYELPEAQLDRFLLKEILGYPSVADELQILDRIKNHVFDEPLTAANVVQMDDIIFLQELTKKVYVDTSVQQYIVNIVTSTRNAGAVISKELARYVEFGSSPRGSIALQQVSQALAILNGRSYVVPEDVKTLRHSALRHRIILNFEALADAVHSEAIIDAIYGAVTTP